MDNIIDCKGLQCPQPVIITKKYFDSIKSGNATVIVDNDVAKNNILKFAESSGFKCAFESKEGLFYINISKESCCTSVSINNNAKVFTIVVGSNTLGNGDDKLGAVLMKSYMFALSESNDIPTNMLFINGGVKLTTEGSDCIDSLKKLQDKGMKISSCGTCLDFYGLKEKLIIGDITNMYTIVEKMNSSDLTIKL